MVEKLINNIGFVLPIACVSIINIWFIIKIDVIYNIIGLNIIIISSCFSLRAREDQPLGRWGAISISFDPRSEALVTQLAHLLTTEGAIHVPPCCIIYMIYQ